MPWPYPIFDYLANERPGWLWCLRCEDWIPISGARGDSHDHDPHVQDHRDAYYLMKAIDATYRNQEIEF